jgi:hypothetical protein
VGVDRRLVHQLRRSHILLRVRTQKVTMIRA